VLVDNSTAVVTTVDLDGRGIVVFGTSGGHSSVVILAFFEISAPSLEVAVLVESGRAWWRSVVRWAAVLENSDGRGLIIFGSSSIPGCHVVVSWSELSGPTGEVSMLVHDGTTLISTRNLNR